MGRFKFETISRSLRFLIVKNNQCNVTKIRSYSSKTNIDLYVTNWSIPSAAALLTAKYLEVPINLKNLNFLKNEHLSPQYSKINPLNSVPTIVDDGFVLWESRAIMQYLVNKYAADKHLYPNTPSSERALIDRALYFDSGSLFPAVAGNYYGPLFRNIPSDPEKEENFKKQIKILDTVYLSKTKYVAGNNVTLGDLAVLATLTFVQKLTDFDFTPYSNVATWLQNIKTEISCYQEVMEKLKLYK